MVRLKRSVSAFGFVAMNYPTLLVDAIALMMALRIPAALICLYKAALSMGSGWNASGIFAGQFGRWMGWAIVFLTLPGVLQGEKHNGPSQPAGQMPSGN